MNVKRAILRGLICCTVIFAMSAAAPAAVVHIEGPIEVTVGSEGTAVAEFELIIDSSTAPLVDFFDYSLMIDGLAVAFDYDASTAGTNGVYGDAGRVPKYLFQGDHDFVSAGSIFGAGDQSFYLSDGIGYDLGSPGYSPNAPEGISLGVFVVNITGVEAEGIHTITGGGFTDFLGEPGAGPDGTLLGTSGNDGISIPDFSFEVIVPEPATMSLLVLGGLSVLARRKRR
jgi:hypothetical protein